MSLGSVLLLAAIGLAITFGVMGVINMAHGEMVMLGAYTTFVVQEVIRAAAPGLFDYSLAIALPLAFLVIGRVGIADRTRHHPLPVRPAARNAARDLGPVADPAAGGALDLRADQPRGRRPSWMSGTFELGGLAITWNRLWIVVFALVVFALLLLHARTARAGACRCAPSRRTGAWPPPWASAPPSSMR
jgi:urea transport system permease protein